MSAAPTDLCTLSDVKNALSISTSTDDTYLQELITWAGLYWLGRTSRDTIGQALSFTESYDGHGGRRLFLQNFPINSVASLTINGQTVQPSTQPVNAPRGYGYLIDQSKKSIVLVGNPTFWKFNFPCLDSCFTPGFQNVVVTYNAGNATIPLNVQNASVRQVMYWYKQRPVLNQSSVIAGESGGSTIYRSWEIPPEVETEIQNQMRRSLG